MVKKMLLRKPRIYVAICDVCDHARTIHAGYHSDIFVATKGDYCLIDGCECTQFKAPSLTKPRSPYTIEAARSHVEGIISYMEREVERYGSYQFHSQYCGHCGQYQDGDHIIEHELKPILDHSREDRNKLEEIVKAWELTATLSEETEKNSSMPLKNSQSCAMFRCLKCFRYIFPDDDVAKDGDGFAHKVCLSKRGLIRS